MFLRIEEPIAQAAGEAASPPGCAFFFWGDVKRIFNNSDFGYERGALRSYFRLLDLTRLSKLF
jgi:hypothetical protein